MQRVNGAEAHEGIVDGVGVGVGLGGGVIASSRGRRDVAWYVISRQSPYCSHSCYHGGVCWHALPPCTWVVCCCSRVLTLSCRYWLVALVARACLLLSSCLVWPLPLVDSGDANAIDLAHVLGVNVNSPN